MPKLDFTSDANLPYLTDGGLETWLFFQQGFEAPEFAAITLMDDGKACVAMRDYFDSFLGMAEAAQTGFVLDTVTWRGCVEWAGKLRMSEDNLLRLSTDAVKFARAIKHDWEKRVPQILVNGVVGPLGDGYAPDRRVGADQAQAVHTPQIHLLAKAGVDMISAITITNVAEAIGIVNAAGSADISVVISFTVETDGRLPTGDLLGEAIEMIDTITDCAPAYYMVNCAHPDHFRHAFANGDSWIRRIGGVRANASRLSHAELDEAETLDEGDPEEFGMLHAQLARLLPNLLVVGGCCGTDHRHVKYISKNLHELLLQPAEDSVTIR